MKMIDSIMTIPLIIGILYLVFFAYRKVRIDLFRDKVFKIRRSLFLIAADNPDEFFKDNSSYRFFESIFNVALSYTEGFSLLSSVFDTNIRLDYAKRKQVDSFDFDTVKKFHLKKIQSLETRKDVAKLLNEFQFHYNLFLLTRTFLGSIASAGLIVFVLVFLVLQTFVEKQQKSLKERTFAFFSRRTNRIMSNSQFALASSIVNI